MPGRRPGTPLARPFGQRKRPVMLVRIANHFVRPIPVCTSSSISQPAVAQCRAAAPDSRRLADAAFALIGSPQHRHHVLELRAKAGPALRRRRRARARIPKEAVELACTRRPAHESVAMVRPWNAFSMTTIFMPISDAHRDLSRSIAAYWPIRSYGEERRFHSRQRAQ